MICGFVPRFQGLERSKVCSLWHFQGNFQIQCQHHPGTQLLFCFWNQWKWLSKVELTWARAFSNLLLVVWDGMEEEPGPKIIPTLDGVYTKLLQTPLQQNASSMESNTFCLYCNIHSKHFLIKNKCIMIYKNGNTFSHFYTYCEENTVKILRRRGKNDGMSLLNWWMDPLNRVSYMQSTHHP